MPTYSVTSVYTNAARTKYAAATGAIGSTPNITTTAGYFQPAVVGNTVSVSVNSTDNLLIGQIVSVLVSSTAVGSYTVVAVPSSTLVTLKLETVGSVALGGAVSFPATIPTLAGNVFRSVTSFKVGLGGWLPSGAPRTPDPTLTDLDIILDQSRPLSQKRYPAISPALGYTSYFYSKSVGAMTASSNQLTVPCQLISAEYNNDGVGNPVIWEIGLYDASNMMVVYGTFSGVTKDATKTLDFSNVLVF